MRHYFIEFRFFGKAKHQIKQMICGVDKKFNLGATRRKRAVPHITIISPFTTSNERMLIHDFKQICSKYPLMKFEVNGYGCFENSRVVYIDIKPEEKLVDFYKEFLKRLSKYCKLDKREFRSFLGIFKFYGGYHPHATIAKRLSPQDFRKIKDYVHKKEKFRFKNYVLRVTLIKSDIILKEYDFLLKRLLNRGEAKSKRVLNQTFRLLKGKLNPEAVKEICNKISAV